jgi:hypothetical protein
MLVVFGRAAELQVVRDVRDALHNLLVDVALGEDARAAHTGLPGVHEGAEGRHGAGRVQVGVIEDDDR